MGVTALECCAPAASNAQELRGELRPGALPQADYLRLRTQLRLMNLVTAVGEQIRRFEGSSKQVEEINQEFHQISSFLEMIDYEAEHAFLNILHSCSKNGEEGRHQLCVVDISSLKAGSPQLQSELKQCFKILSLLQIPQPLPDCRPQVIEQIINSELSQIPDSCSFLWDQQRCFSDVQEYAQFLKYQCHYLLPRVNGHLSLNNPTSFLHVRHLFHLLSGYLCQAPLRLTHFHFRCSLRAHPVESLLYRAGNLVVTTDFLPFEAEEGSASEEGTAGFCEEAGTERVVLHVQVSSQGSWNSKFLSKGKLYWLPFTIFSIRRTTQRQNLLEVCLAELKEQSIHDELRRCGERQEEREDNQVIITQSNLLGEMKALRDSLSLQLEQVRRERSVSSSLDEMLMDFYSLREQGLEVVETESIVEEFPLSSSQVPLKEESWDEPEELPTVQLTPETEKVYQKQVINWIKEHSLDRVVQQLCEVRHFYLLTELNLSQNYLQKMECLECFPNLTRLFLYSNLIERIEGIHHNSALQLLSLSRNRISELSGLDHLLRLRYLYLSKNRLGQESAVYLGSLGMKHLKELSISFGESGSECFQALTHKLSFKIGCLVINEADRLSERTKNMLKKRLRTTEITFFRD